MTTFDKTRGGARQSRPRWDQCGTAIVLCVALGLLFPAAASAQENVVSYRGTTASANDIIKSFMGGGSKAQKHSAVGQPKFRGIRFDNPTPPVQQPEPPAEQQQAAPAEEQPAMQASAQPAAAPAAEEAAPQEAAPQAVASVGECPASGNAVALEINFAVNSAVLEADAYRNLRQMAEAMNSEELHGCRFTVEGHTDASGSAGYNLKLSKLRAESVANFLKSSEIPASRLVEMGKGSKEPLDPADPYAPENRRVQFRIIGSSGG